MFFFQSFFQVQLENMHHCFTANNKQYPDTDVERSQGTDDKLFGKIYTNNYLLHGILSQKPNKYHKSKL